MANDWMLDVLADLKSFAESNGLGATEQQLDRTMITVAHELALTREVTHGTAQGVGHVREFHRSVTGSRNTQRP